MTADSHEEFLELCALATIGELTAEEWTRLNEHLAHCDACLRASRELEEVIATTIPALAAESAAAEGVEDAPATWSIEQAERILMESLNAEPSSPKAELSAEPSSSPSRLSPLLAIAAMVLAACCLAAYQIGVHHGRIIDAPAARAGTPTPNPLPHLGRSYNPTAPANGNNRKSEDERAAPYKEQARMNQLELNRVEKRQSQLEGEVAKESAELGRSVQDRAELNRQLTLTQSNAERLEARLSQIDNQKSQEAEQSIAIRAQVNDLTAAIQQKDKEIAQEQELLQHDRDIRNLIGARNLYMAEIYDVAKTGDTQKPFGRVFYTKDKSLIFYGYDLDQQLGLKCRFANYLANFCANYVAHSFVWTSFPQSRNPLAISLCSVSRCCDHIWRGSDRFVPLHRKLRSPIERRLGGRVHIVKADSRLWLVRVGPIRETEDSPQHS